MDSIKGLVDYLADRSIDSGGFIESYLWFVLYAWFLGSVLGVPLFFGIFGLLGLLGVEGWLGAAIGGYVGAIVIVDSLAYEELNEPS